MHLELWTSELWGLDGGDRAKTLLPLLQPHTGSIRICLAEEEFGLPHTTELLKEWKALWPQQLRRSCNHLQKQQHSSSLSSLFATTLLQEHFANNPVDALLCLHPLAGFLGAYTRLSLSLEPLSLWALPLELKHLEIWQALGMDCYWSLSPLHSQKLESAGIETSRIHPVSLWNTASNLSSDWLTSLTGGSAAAFPVNTQPGEDSPPPAPLTARQWKEVATGLFKEIRKTQNRLEQAQEKLEQWLSRKELAEQAGMSELVSEATAQLELWERRQQETEKKLQKEESRLLEWKERNPEQSSHKTETKKSTTTSSREKDFARLELEEELQVLKQRLSLDRSQLDSLKDEE